MRNLTRKGAIKRKRISEERIAFVLRQAESGTAIEEIRRKKEISEPTFYHWKRVHGG
jgi:putative transposase